MSFLDRRQFIGSALALPAIGRVLADTALAGPAGSGQPQSGLLVLYRADSAVCAASAVDLQAAGWQVLALENDLVRQWRGLQASGQLDDIAQLCGLGNWDDYFLIQGLAAETRLWSLQSLHQQGPLFSWSLVGADPCVHPA